MKQEIVRKRNESISTIIIFICSSLERLARQRQQQMNVLPKFFLPFVGGPQTISILYLPGIEADVVTYLVPSGWSIAEQFQTNLLK